jgi:hypothetical protein
MTRFENSVYPWFGLPLSLEPDEQATLAETRAAGSPRAGFDEEAPHLGSP